MKTLSIFSAIALLVVLEASGRAQNAASPSEPPAGEAAAPAAGDELSVEQARLADRFKRLEEVLGQLAELSASTDPRRARLLREAIARSREQDINVRFESIVKLLEDERLSAATNNQKELQSELDALLSLLLKADRDRELASQRDRVRAYLKEVIRLLRMQKGVRARTEGGDALRGLSEDQQRIAADTGKLGGEIADTQRDEKKDGDETDSENGDKPDDGERQEGDDGKPKPREGESSKSGEKSKPGDSSKPGESSEGDSKSPQAQPGEGQPSPGKPGKPSESPPSDSSPSQGQSGEPSQNGDSGEQSPSQEPTDRAAERLRRAAQQMEAARKKLDEAERDGAADRQREAQRQLELAQADLERVLRQLREEELERTLTQLAARFRKMLEWQNEVYEGTQRLEEVPPAKRDHDDEIEAARLSRQESQILHEADKALLLLREEGSSVAFPETVELMRDDIRKVVERLAAMKVERITQGLEEDIIEALEEMIAALEKAIKDLEKKRPPQGQPPGPGEPAEPSLVNDLAELKMIRALQMRINKRTQRYGEMIEGEQAEAAELLEALEELSQQQERVYKATFDLEQGRNN